jgi:pilus assembly protein CpaC
MIDALPKARLKRLALLALAGSALVPTGAVAGQSPFPSSAFKPSHYDATGLHPDATAPEANAGHTVRVSLGASAGARVLALPRGKSATIDLPVDAHDVLVSDPKTADVVLSTPRRIYVMGLSAGQTDAVFVDGNGRQILRLDIRVDQDVSALGQTLSRVLPGSSVRVEAVNESLILSGEVASAADADKAVRIAQSFVGSPERVINMLSVADSEQVMLKVRVVEVNRTVIKQLGVNLNAIIGQLGSTQFTLANAATWGVNGSLLGGLTGGYSTNTTQQPELNVLKPVTTTTQQVVTGANGVTSVVPITSTTMQPFPQVVRNNLLATLQPSAGSNGLNQASAMLDAFEQVGLVRTLAEPNLTAVSGESAKFLAGGEFPVPTSQDNNGRVSVEFKPFGVGLGFTPLVLSHGRISLKLSTEVSELSTVGGFTMTSSTTTTSGTSTAPSLTVPGLNVRRAETVVELPSGGSLMIAGLLQSTSKETLSSLPGLMQLPVLGALFRSRDFQNNETELVIIVTPYLVKPVRPDQLQTPADGLQIADDMSTTLLGQLNKGFNKPAPPPGKTYQGPYGYVVE